MTHTFYTHVAQHKNDILLRGFRDGKRIQERVQYKPYVFVNSAQHDSVYRTIDGKPVGKVEFDSIGDARTFIKENTNVAGVKLYGFTDFPYNFIYDNYRGQIEYNPSLLSIVGLDIEVDIASGGGFPDIQQAENEITLITLSRNGKTTTLGCQPFEDTDDTSTYILCRNEKHLLKVFLELWGSVEFDPDIVTGWNIEFFDIPYIINRIMRVLGEKEAKRMSPWNILRESTVEIMGNLNQVWNPVGVSILDYQQLYKKFGFTPQERYTLDHVATEELGEGKLDYGEYDSLAELQKNDWRTYVLYNIKDVKLIDRLESKRKLLLLAIAMAYDAKINFQDTFTTVRAWDVIIHAYLLDRRIVVPMKSVPENDRGILGGYVKDPQVGMHEWIVSYDLNSLYPHLIMQYNISPETFVGWLDGYDECDNKDVAEDRVMRTIDGVVYSDSIQKYLKDNNLALAGNWTVFRRDKVGFLPALMRRYYDERVKYKKLMKQAETELEQAQRDLKALSDSQIDQRNKLNAMIAGLEDQIAAYNSKQMALKIQLNSCYGALGNVWFRWFRLELAEAITSSGQLTTRWLEKHVVNKYLNRLLKTGDADYVLAADTDSCYISLKAFVDACVKDNPSITKDEITELLVKFGTTKLQNVVDEGFQSLCDMMNGCGQMMNTKLERVSDRGIWTAKKRYVLNVRYQEGVTYDTPKVKMTGIEAIRTSTPAVCRTAIKQTLFLTLNEDEKTTQDYIEKFRNNFMAMSFEQIAKPSSVNNLSEYADRSSIFKKGAPPHVRGSLIYNHALKERELTAKYEAIGSGQKIRWAYCTMPNPLHTSAIAAPASLPPELNMDAYIDKKMQFEKTYLDPIQNIFDKIGWTTEERLTLFDFLA